MFTGIVQTLATVASVRVEPPGKRLWVRAPREAAACRVGESIAVNGCCLTVVETDDETLVFEAGPETLRRTNLDVLAAGGDVNLETSLRMGDSLSGHFVTGHIDGTGTLAIRTDDGAWSTLWFECPAELTRQMASKGSVAVDGVSLTLVDVECRRFSVQLIPHTLAVTTLGRIRIGDRVNLETDLLAKYVQKLCEGVGRSVGGERGA
jgi:riboflavin synthase